MSERSESSAVHYERRYWRRTSSAAPWWPWGLLPLIGLCLLFLLGALFMAPRIEAEVNAQVSQRLSGTDLRETKVSSSGQGITVNALGYADQKPYVDALARSTQCDTWAGRLTCPTTVAVHLSEPPAAPTPVIEPEPEVVVQAEPAVDVEREAFLQRQQQCNSDFLNAMSGTSIRFRTGSAVIDAGNEELLTRLAGLAADCPGDLRIEGHTDSQGEEAANQALSLARANAVRDALASRGIDINRLSARGFGETQPIADNATALGRQQNRRIVISVEEQE